MCVVFTCARVAVTVLCLWEGLVRVLSGGVVAGQHRPDGVEVVLLKVALHSHEVAVPQQHLALPYLFFMALGLLLVPHLPWQVFFFV